MKMPNKMMIAVGAFALTATTLLAGCGSSSNDAPEAPAAEVPTSVFEGAVKPADVADETWATYTSQIDGGLPTLAKDALPKMCADGPVEVTESLGEEMAGSYGGTVEEWMQVMTVQTENSTALACSLSE